MPLPATCASITTSRENPASLSRCLRPPWPERSPFAASSRLPQLSSGYWGSPHTDYSTLSWHSRLSGVWMPLHKPETLFFCHTLNLLIFLPQGAVCYPPNSLFYVCAQIISPVAQIISSVGITFLLSFVWLENYLLLLKTVKCCLLVRLLVPAITMASSSGSIYIFESL